MALATIIIAKNDKVKIKNEVAEAKASKAKPSKPGKSDKLSKEAESITLFEVSLKDKKTKQETHFMSAGDLSNSDIEAAVRIKQGRKIFFGEHVDQVLESEGLEL